MMKTQFEIGQSVRKIKPKSDYTFGRIGIIVDIGYECKRVRVKWLHEADGSYITTCGAKPGNGVRLWVSSKNIELTFHN